MLFVGIIQSQSARRKKDMPRLLRAYRRASRKLTQAALAVSGGQPAILVEIKFSLDHIRLNLSRLNSKDLKDIIGGVRDHNWSSVSVNV
jgi:hypothetical protein